MSKVAVAMIALIHIFRTLQMLPAPPSKSCTSKLARRIAVKEFHGGLGAADTSIEHVHI